MSALSVGAPASFPGVGDLNGGNFGSWSIGVTADGSTVVERSISGSGYEAFIWDQANGMRNLCDVLVNDCGLNLTGWTLVEARGISDDDMTIVGYGINPSGDTEAWVARLPEPAALTLLTLGGLAMLRRRR